MDTTFRESAASLTTVDNRRYLSPEQAREMEREPAAARRSARIDEARDNLYSQLNRKQRRKLAAEYRKQYRHAL